MAVEQDGIDITLPANADRSSDQFKLLLVEDDGQVGLAAGSGTIGVGVLQNKPAAANRAAVVRVAGVSKCVASDAINERDLITSNAQGFADATTTDGAAVWGQAITAAAGSAQVFSLLLHPFRY